MNNFDAGNRNAPTQPTRWGRWIAPVASARKTLRLSQGAGANGSGRRRWIIPLAIGVVILLLLGVAGNGLAIYMTHSSMQRDKAALDSALVAARAQYNVPPSRLAPIASAEARAVAATDGSFPSYQRADTTLVQLTRQLNGLTHIDPAQAKAMTQADLTALSSGVDTLVKANYVEAKGFQTRLSQAQTQFAAAATTTQYFAVDTYTLDQLGAVTAFQPTYQRLQDLTKFVSDENLLINGSANASATSDLQCAQGLNDAFWLDDPQVQVKNTSGATIQPTVLPEAAWPAADLTQLRAASTSADFVNLNHTFDSQTQQAQTNEASLLPTVAKNLLTEFQSDITLMKQQNQDTSSYDPLYTQDQQQQQTLTATPSLAGYVTLVTTLRKQINQIGLPLIKAKTNSDLAAFNALLKQGLALKTVDPANGVAYPDAYEYADPNTGIGDATQRLASAQTAQDYQLVDNEILMFTQNLTAMIQDTKDPTFNILDPNNPNAYWKVPHQTDLTLMNYYGLTNTRVIVISFVEQAARLYDNGKLVKGFKVTTGAQDLPSVPGIHCGLDHLKDTVFKSPDPPGSPNYYLPTPIHYAVDYSYYGYALHDAWWRSWFGRYSNLPHYDPAAFNGGSHGCINFGYYNGDAAYMWNFVQQGTPIIVY